jgi:hypothetical protein
MTTDLDRAAEYAAATESWRAFSKEPINADTAGRPLVVVLLAGLCEPPPYGDGFTGDVIADVLGALRGFVDRIEKDAADGGGGGIFVHNPALEAWQRRIDAVLTLRSYERIHREQLARTIGEAGAKGGAP